MDVSNRWNRARQSRRCWSDSASGAVTRSSSETASPSSALATERWSLRAETGSSSPAPSPAASAHLYLITPAREDLAAFLEAAIRGGVDMVQVRDKELPDGELLRALEDA